MKNKKVILGVLLTLCMAFGAGVFAGAATSKAEPGSSGDPLITKSYLEERLSQINGSNISNTENQSSKEIATLKKQVEELKKQVKDVKAEAQKGSFKKVTVKKGKALIVKYGAEVVFYSGTATWKTSNNSYILDLTERNHVSNGASAILYHNYLIRSGCNLEAAKDMVVYVRGTYSVK